MQFTQVGKRKYESATVREPNSQGKDALRYSRSLPGSSMGNWVAVNGNLTSMAEIADAIKWLQTITEDHFRTDGPDLMAPPADLMAPPAASDAETFPCHPDYREGDIITTADGTKFICLGNGKARRA